MFDFLKSLFNPAPPSSSTAKERLRLVLLSDHLSLAPDVVEALKKDLLAVISRYVTIDSAHADVTFEHREKEVAMLANIPITGVRARSAEERPALAVPTPTPAPKTPEPVAALIESAAPVEPVEAPSVASPSEAQPDSEAAPATAPATVKTPSRRRRRKKAPNPVSGQPKLSGAQPGFSAQG